MPRFTVARQLCVPQLRQEGPMADRVALAVVSRPRTGRCSERGVCARDGRPRFLILIVPLLGVVAYFSVGCNHRLPGRSRTRQRHRISAGASVKSVQRMLGHASATLTSTGTATCSRTSRTTWRGGWTGQPARRGCTERVQKRIRPSWTMKVRRPKMAADLRFCWVPPAGFEPATHGLGNRRSIP
jgi:hypothetical protein